VLKYFNYLFKYSTYIFKPIQWVFYIRIICSCFVLSWFQIFWSSVLKITRPLGQTNWKWKWHPELTETEATPPSFGQQQVGCWSQNPRSGNGFLERTRQPQLLWFFGRQSLCIIGSDTLVSDNSDLCRPSNFVSLINFSLGPKKGVDKSSRKSILVFGYEKGQTAI